MMLKQKHVFELDFSEISKKKFNQKLDEVNWDNIRTFENKNEALNTL